MTLYRIFAIFALTTAGAAFAGQAAIKPDSMGLSKGSVFDVPNPKVFTSKAGQPGQNTVLPRAFPGAPPQIPHDVGDFLPITAQNNLCLACHNQPEQWGKKREEGMPTPIPQSHYTDLRNAPGKVGDHLVNARYNCNQCHVPQMNAAPLVESTFSSPGRR